MPDEEPPKIEFRRWRHKERGYIVEVEQVTNYRGKHGYLTVVVLKRSGMVKSTSWHATTFLKAFTPISRRIRRKNRWELLRED
jgi:hypothetical protein